MDELESNELEETTPGEPEDVKPYYYTYLTEKGLALMAKQQLNMTRGEGPPLEIAITRAVAGSGYVDPVELPYLTDVLEPIGEMEFGPYERIPGDSKAVRLPLRLSGVGLTDTALIRLIGVYAMDPDEGEILYEVLQYEVFQPLPSLAANYGAVSFFDCEIILTFFNGEATAIPTSPGWFLSSADLVAHNNDPLAHHANNAQQELCTLQHNLDRLPGCDAACLEYAAGIAPAGEGYPGGTDPVTFRPEVKYHSRNALTVLVPQKYAREVAAVNQLRENEYAVIYKEGIESLLILLR